MRYGQNVVSSLPDPKVISIRQLPENVDIETSSWTSSSRSTANTFIVDESEVTIAVMGATGSGKTTFINAASGSSLRIGKGLQSCTSIVQVAQAFELDGRSVTLIDTPGFDDTTKSDADILRMIAAFLATAYQNGKKLAGVIYIHRISDFRMGGISTRNFKMFRQLCGESTLKNVVIVTNMWGEVSLEVGEAREAELASQDMFFKPVLDKGGQLLRHENSSESAHNILRSIVENHPISLQIQRELVDQKKDISQTAAGEELNREMMIQIQKHRNEMRMLQEEMREAIRTKDEETRKELEIETRKLQAEMNRVQSDSQKLVSEYNEEKNKMERRMQELSESARQDAERVTAEYSRQISALQTQLQSSTSSSAAERFDMVRQIEELQRRGQRSGGGGGGFFGMLGKVMDGVFGW
ncbi:P-loop containing nucleoside triphosphate hydrolase protein [Crassisporium funariophilum]|nr:P-loop containing nucleoside triphosphate hydrolase protein [Crassisporium funariophilum]